MHDLDRGVIGASNGPGDLGGVLCVWAAGSRDQNVFDTPRSRADPLDEYVTAGPGNDLVYVAAKDEVLASGPACLPSVSVPSEPSPSLIRESTLICSRKSG